MYYLLYNLEANNSSSKDNLIKLYSEKFEGITPIIFNGLDFEKFSKSINNVDTIILSGGDGTINHFVNLYKKYPFEADILYSADGTGNDFLRDIEKDNLVRINEYINDLPKVIINNEERYFVNNSSFGLDGTVCEIADILKKKGKKINYTNIAAKLLLFKYKPTNAKVIVDGKEYNYKNVWLASSMNGRYVGGGMMLAPTQDRLGNELSCVVIHGKNRLKIAIAFKTIFTGEHIKKYPKYVDIIKGKNIYVEFDRPNSIQVDGEVTLNVTSYTAQRGD